MYSRNLHVPACLLFVPVTVTFEWASALTASSRCLLFMPSCLGQIPFTDPTAVGMSTAKMNPPSPFAAPLNCVPFERGPSWNHFCSKRPFWWCVLTTIHFKGCNFSANQVITKVFFPVHLWKKEFYNRYFQELTGKASIYQENHICVMTATAIAIMLH